MNIAGRLKEICQAHTTLSQAQIARLLPIAESLPVIANLVEADVFIDCMTKLKETAIVAAEAFPESVASSYRGSVLGEYALAQNEPAVLKSLMLSVPTRQMKGITQEKAEVVQSVEPIWHEGENIGVLIFEKRVQSQALMLKSEAVNELHHRVKNNLQTIASIISIEARGCANVQAQAILSDTVSRILAVSAAHELILNRKDDTVDLKELAEDIGGNILKVASRPNCRINYTVVGENCTAASDTAGEVGMVLHEALMNALKYAFVQKVSGRLTVKIDTDRGYPQITVQDDGCGFDVPAHTQSGLGLALMQSIVRDQLLGSFQIASNHSGTSLCFSIRK